MKTKKKKHAAKKAARRVKRSTPRPPEPAIIVAELGHALEIVYRRTKDGKPYRHAFGSAVKLYRTRDGKQLIVGPVNAGDWIRG